MGYRAGRVKRRIETDSLMMCPPLPNVTLVVFRPFLDFTRFIRGYSKFFSGGHLSDMRDWIESFGVKVESSTPAPSHRTKHVAGISSSQKGGDAARCGGFFRADGVGCHLRRTNGLLVFNEGQGVGNSVALIFRARQWALCARPFQVSP